MNIMNQFTNTIKTMNLINKKKKSTIFHISTVYPLSTYVLSVPSLSQMIELQSFLNTQVVWLAQYDKGDDTLSFHLLNFRNGVTMK